MYFYFIFHAFSSFFLFLMEKKMGKWENLLKPRRRWFRPESCMRSTHLLVEIHNTNAKPYLHKLTFKSINASLDSLASLWLFTELIYPCYKFKIAKTLARGLGREKSSGCYVYRKWQSISVTIWTQVRIFTRSPNLELCSWLFYLIFYVSIF